MSEILLLDKKMNVKGLHDLCYAVITKDDESGTTYGPVKRVQGVQTTSYVPQSNAVKSYGDNGTYCTVTTGNDADLEIGLNEIPDAMQVDWFGHSLDANGALVENKNDTPNEIAVGYKATKTNGADRMVWNYKCTPSLPEEQQETEKGSEVTIQTRKIKLTASPRASDGQKRAVLDSDMEGLAASVVANWTKAVYEKATTKTEDTPQG